MGAALAIARKDLGQRWRDRTALLVGLVAPLLLAFLISLAFGRGEFEFSATVGVADLDGGPLARAFVDDVLGSPDLAGILTVRPVASREEAEGLAVDDDVAASYVIPAGFSEAAQGPAPLPIEVIRSAGSPYGASVAESIAQGYTARLDSIRLGVATALQASGAPPDDATVGRLAEAAAAQPPAIATEDLDAGDAGVNPGSVFAPAMGIFFLYYVASLGARNLLTERSQGTLARLLAAPVPRRSILWAKAGATFLLGLASLTAMAVASTLLLGADWGAPLPALTLIVAITFAVTGITAVVLALARTEAQVNMGMTIVIFAMALLGGNFVSLSRAPQWLQQVSLLTPNGQALRGFQDLASEGGGFATVVAPVAVLLALGVATFAVAAANASRLVAR